MAVINMTVGAITPTGATFAVKVDDGPVRIAVADNESMDNPTFFGPESIDGNGATKVVATGLENDTRYWWQVEDDGVLDTSLTGQLLTDPPVGSRASFTIGAAGDAGLTPDFPGVGSVLASNRLSNHPVFDTIRERALNEGWRRFIHLGDHTYYDLGSGQHGITGGGSLSNYRRMFDDMLLQPRQHHLYREVPLELCHDDHDRGPNDHDSTYADGVNYNRTYRERVAHYDLPDSDPEGGLYRSFQIGRVLFIVADTRTFRDPNTDPDGPSKTMLGTAQKNWMANILSTTDAKAFVWVNPHQFTTSTDDSWASYQFERAEMVSMFSATGWLHRMCILGADSHSLYIITENFTRTIEPLFAAHVAQFHFASLDATPTAGPQSDTGPNSPGRDQYGTLKIDDTGTHIVITGTGYQGVSHWRSYSITIATGDPLITPNILRSISKSHAVTIEAKVVTNFQVGVNPTGTPIPVIEGSVHLDGTADIRGTLELVTDGNKMFPRGKDMLLSPYGNEIFVRRGIDFGSHIEWVALGYYRIDSVEQEDSHSGRLRISGSDRMSTILDSKLMDPRQYLAGVTVDFVFNDLVREIYPNAVIFYDDNVKHFPIGRSMVAEDSRLDAIKNIATSLGKVIFWNTSGIMLVVSPPNNSTIAWDINAGRDGVLVSSSRRTSREGVYNAVVVLGEGSDDMVPVRAIAVDAHPSSRTRFGGPFGKIPRFFTSPIVTTAGQAQTAAQMLIRRVSGLPYSVDFGSLVNPGIQPFDVVRIEQADGNREIHSIETVSIPLDAAGLMSGTTRDTTFQGVLDG